MTTKEVCLLLAKRYRKRAASVSAGKIIPYGICSVLSSTSKKEILPRQRATIQRYVDELPNVTWQGHKFPIDSSGFLLRAKWLEELSKKFK